MLLHIKSESQMNIFNSLNTEGNAEFLENVLKLSSLGRQHMQFPKGSSVRHLIATLFIKVNHREVHYIQSTLLLFNV